MTVVLAFDIDGTVLSRPERLGANGRPKEILDMFLSILRHKEDALICFITGNDYEGLQVTRVAQPIVTQGTQIGMEADLSRVVIYADGATRKFTYESGVRRVAEDAAYRDGQPERTSRRPRGKRCSESLLTS